MHICIISETGANPTPIILVKTIIGLDNFKEQNRLSGSLLLLQVCNQNLSFYFILLYGLHIMVLYYIDDDEDDATRYPLSSPQHPRPPLQTQIQSLSLNPSLTRLIWSR